MAKTSTIAKCALCLQEKKLCKSHYLGNAIHKLMNEESLDGRQIVFTPNLITQTPRQLWAHLLCNECEGRINKFGEGPTLKLIRRADTFPLLDLTKQIEPIRAYRELAVYSGRTIGIDIEALAYYALSLAWRGSVKEWKTLRGQITTAPLGAFEEHIRQYLAGEAELPKNVFVVVRVCTDEASQLIVNAPYRLPVQGDAYLQIEMLVRGTWLVVLAGDAVPDRMRSRSLLASSAAPIYVRDCTDQVEMRNQHFRESAENELKRLP